MSDPVWYYARGNVEQGPITAAQIQALAATGSLRKDDLVWKEGMGDWVPAGGIEELFPQNNKRRQETTPDEAPPKKDVFRQMPPPTNRRATADAEPLLRTATRLLVAGSFLLVLLSRGCDGLATRNVARLKGIAAATEARFEAGWAAKMSDLEAEQHTLTNKENLAAEERQRLTAVNDELTTLTAERDSERQRLRASDWQEHSLRADTEEADQMAWSFWWQVVFLFGTVALSVGLFGVAMSADGPERWVSLALLGVILYSIYTGSSVW